MTNIIQLSNIRIFRVQAVLENWLYIIANMQWLLLVFGSLTVIFGPPAKLMMPVATEQLVHLYHLKVIKYSSLKKFSLGYWKCRGPMITYTTHMVYWITKYILYNMGGKCCVGYLYIYGARAISLLFCYHQDTKSE